MTDSRRAGRIPPGWSLALCACICVTGCESLFKSGDKSPSAAGIAAPTLPGKAGAHRVSQFVFYSDTPLKPSAPLFDELSHLRDQIFRDLQLPPSDTIVQVYLFDDQTKYERFMRFRYPELPDRRAYFVAHPGTPGGPRELLVYTYWGDHLRQDLRHELTHALLHSVLKDVPLWLDEGLAEYYELPPERDGLNALHVDALRRSSMQPDLAALERLDKVKDMGRSQYQESWAWVHLMLRGSPQSRAVLLGYLHQLQDPMPPGPLLPRLREVYPAPGAALAQHLCDFDAPAATIRPVVDRR